MARPYEMRKRAQQKDDTSARIVRATMALHDIKGVSDTTFSEIAERAGVGLATVLRHFPSQGDLVRACGAHVWQEMRPPVPDLATEIFAGTITLAERLTRLVDELDAFHERGALRLSLASMDRKRVPELEQFLQAVEAGVAAMVREAFRHANLSPNAIRLAGALLAFPVWQALDGLRLPAAARRKVIVGLVTCATRASGSL